jgi:hypothetical protein
MDIATVQDKCELFTAFDGPRRAGPVMAHKTLDSPADLFPPSSVIRTHPRSRTVALLPPLPSGMTAEL